MFRRNISRTVRASVGVTLKNSDATDVGAETVLFLGLSDDAIEQIGKKFFGGESPDYGEISSARLTLTRLNERPRR